MADDTSSLMGFLGSLYDRAAHGPSIFTQPFGGAPVNNKGVDPNSVVRALKGDRQGTSNLGDYSVGNKWYMYGPNYNPETGAPAEGDMDKDPSHPIYKGPSNWGYPPSQEHGWGNKITQGMFGVPAQHLQQMAGDVVPFPRQPGQVLEPEQYQRALDKMKGVDTRKLLDDVLGAPGSVVPFPSPPTPAG